MFFKAQFSKDTGECIAVSESVPDKRKNYYRTISEAGDIIETWDRESEVNPIEDYYRIQWVIDWKVIDEWDSIYTFRNLPF